MFTRDLPEVAVYRPWHLRNFAALSEYLSGLPEETHEWVLALYVDQALGLLAVEAVARGTISSAPVKIGQIICRGRSLGSAGFFLAHNHPSGDATPSQQDIRLTRELAYISRECDVPMLCHVVVASDGMKVVGNW